jgi:hypothetical protein
MKITTGAPSLGSGPPWQAVNESEDQREATTQVADRVLCRKTMNPPRLLVETLPPTGQLPKGANRAQNKARWPAQEPSGIPWQRSRYCNPRLPAGNVTFPSSDPSLVRPVVRRQVRVSRANKRLGTDRRRRSSRRQRPDHAWVRIAASSARFCRRAQLGPGEEALTLTRMTSSGCDESVTLVRKWTSKFTPGGCRISA